MEGWYLNPRGDVRGVGRLMLLTMRVQILGLLGTCQRFRVRS